MSQSQNAETVSGYTFDRLFVDGEWTAPSTDEVFDIRSPHDGTAVGSAPIASESDVDRAVAAARWAFDDGQWPRMSVEERIAALSPFVEAYGARTAELAALVTSEMGSPATFAEAAHGIGPLVLMQQTIEFARTYAWSERRGSSLLIREPAGVVGIITPWNVPQVTIVAKLLPALIAGCTVIVKPAPETPLDAMLLAGLLADADLPPGVVTIVPGATAAGQRLVEHPDVDRIAFTGSADVGRAIARTCGERLARCSLELGGKSAAIVCEDASLERTVAGLRFSSFLNNGQACVAQSRILAPRSRYDEVAEALADAADAFVVGDPSEATTDVGPLVSARQRERVRGYIDVGIAEGAILAAGGSDAIDGLTDGQYVRPTVFRDVDNSMRIAREEIFGPVIVVIPYDGIDDAVRIANDSPYGLGGSVWTKDRVAGLALARRIRTGMFGINSFAPEFGVPFGGFKASGIGREYGPEAFDEYVEMKSVYGVPIGASEATGENTGASEATGGKRVSAPVRRAYGELDRGQVMAALLTLARRVGVQRVTMRELAAEVGAAVPSVYYHVPGKKAALDLLAESVLAGIPEPGPGRWHERLIELYCTSREVLLSVSGIAGVLQTNGDGEAARHQDRLSRELIAQSGLPNAVAGPAHTVLYTYLLGSVSLEESRPSTAKAPSKRQAASGFRAGLELIVTGIQAAAEDS